MKTHTSFIFTVVCLGLALSACSILGPDDIAWIQDNAVTATFSQPEFGSLTDEPNGLFVLGEHHGTLANSEFSKIMIPALVANRNLRVIVLETGYAQGILWNRYVNGGDETIRTDIMNSLGSTASCTQEHAAFFSWLRDYNLALPSDSRLTVIGMDIDHQWFPVRTIVEEYIQNGHADSTALGNFLACDIMSGSGQAAQLAILDTLLQTIGQGELRTVLYSWQQRLLLYADTRPWDERDLVMYDLFSVQYEELRELHPEAEGFSLFGSWGSFHTHKMDTDSQPRLAALIVEAGSRGTDMPAVCSIELLYASSRGFWRAGQTPDTIDTPAAREFLTAVGLDPDASSLQEYALLGIDTPDSPFRTGKRLDAQDNLVGSSADRFDFVLAAAGSAACTAWTTAGQ